jgi:hypothetical protein
MGWGRALLWIVSVVLDQDSPRRLTWGIRYGIPGRWIIVIVREVAVVIAVIAVVAAGRKFVVRARLTHRARVFLFIAVWIAANWSPIAAANGPDVEGICLSLDAGHAHVGVATICSAPIEEKSCQFKSRPLCTTHGSCIRIDDRHLAWRNSGAFFMLPLFLLFQGLDM